MQSVKEAAAAFMANKRVAVTGMSRRPRTTEATPCTSEE
jgi:hypothetical protein